MWDHSDEESCEVEGDGTHAYLGAQFFFYWGTVESLRSVVIQPTHASALADGDGPLSDGKDPYLIERTNEKGFSGL